MSDAFQLSDLAVLHSTVQRLLNEVELARESRHLGSCEEARYLVAVERAVLAVRVHNENVTRYFLAKGTKASLDLGTPMGPHPHAS